MNTPEIDRLNTSYRETLQNFLRNDAGAIAFVSQIFSVLHIWDDLVDRDREVPDGEIIGAFWIALIELPRNPFYRAHFDTLNPILQNAIINWIAANKLEREGDEKDQSVAFILRGAYVDLLSMSALLVGGLPWSIEITPAIRRWSHGETFAEYLANLKIEKDARHVR